MNLWIASSNKGKIDEFKILLNEIPNLQLHLQNEIAGFSQRPEDGKSFLENARIKARTLKAVRSQDWVMADDSGLEVEGLGGLPGIHSSRYAGPKASDSENMLKLLKMMSLRPMANRNACFKATLVVYTPQGEEWIFEGRLDGEITLKPAGLNGFGYDPVFKPKGESHTLAEIEPGFKNRNSHRAQACREFLKKLRETHSISQLG